MLGQREIEKRVEENFPTWEEFSRQKLEGIDPRAQAEIELPPHKVYISSPLHWNFLYILIVLGALALAYAEPTWGPYFVYGAIILIFSVGLLSLARDMVFLHLEGQRLEDDCELINRFAEGQDVEGGAGNGGLMDTSPGQRSSIFRSRLMQIHYQNVLRTFEQGNRRAWVKQEASINEIYTLLTQQGMKLVWTLIEVLPQLGLLGTLLGLTRMFMAFSAEEKLPEVAILAGFGTALGTTILANLFVLILRPIYMRNERTVAEILSTLEVMMATFILPTQQYVLERTRGHQRQQGMGSPSMETPIPGQSRLARAMEDLAHSLEHTQQQTKAGQGAKQPKNLGAAMEEIKSVLHGVQELHAGQPRMPDAQTTQLVESVEGLSRRLEDIFTNGGMEKLSGKLESDLMQLRVLNHDTLLLMEKIATRLGTGVNGGEDSLLSKKPELRHQVFPEQKARIAAAPSGKSPGRGMRFLKGKGR